MNIRRFYSHKLSKLFCAIALFLILLPELCRFALIQFIPRAGWGDMSIEDIDLNLFNATVNISNAQLSQHSQPVISLNQIDLDINWWQTLTNELTIEGATINGLTLSLHQNEQGDWIVVAPISGSDKSANHKVNEEAINSTGQLLLPLLTLEQLALSNSDLTINSPVLQGVFLINHLQINQFSTVRDESLSLGLAAQWNQAPITIDLSGQIKPDYQSLTGTVDIDQLQLGDFSMLIGQPIAALVDSQINLDVKRKLNGYIDAAISKQLSLSQLNSQYQTFNVASNSMQLKGQTQLSLDSDNNISYRSINDLNVDGFKLNDNHNQIAVVDFEALSLSKLTLDEKQQVTLNELRLAKLNALQAKTQQQSHFYNGSFSIDNLSFTPQQGLAIDTIAISDSQYREQINADGEVHSNTLITAITNGIANRETKAPAEETSAEADSAANNEATAFAINHIQLSGDSFLRLEDQRFAQSQQQQLNIKKISIDGINSRQPDKKINLALQGAIGEFSNISITGSASPFKKLPTANISGDVEAMELTDVSPYTAAYLGYHMTKGQYDHQFTIALDNNQLQVDNTLSLRQLELKKASVEQDAAIEQQLDVPLELALDMLRDSDDNIELDVPISGEMDKLGVGLSDVIGKALSSALMSGASNYLKFALQPYGAVLMAAEYIGDSVSSVALDPVVFEPGQEALPAAMQDYQQKIIGLLQQRPSLNLNICGIANTRDKAALATIKAASMPVAADTNTQASTAISTATTTTTTNATQTEIIIEDAELEQLAEQRGKTVKRLLVEAGIESKRLFLCKAEYQAEGQQGVQLSM